MRYELVLPFATPPLSLNQRLHWREKASRTKQVRNATMWIAASKRLPKGVARATVTLIYEPATERRRDTDNLFATLKPCLDGLVDYGLVADDSDRYILSQCRIGEVTKTSRLLLSVEVPDSEVYPQYPQAAG